ncbi:extracellular solute-binding protein [Halanaeroarchaeum sulfurireducens]|nr:extracellular solute-binding protein [Halanaeroarchaeum sulfurireducens]
MAQRSGGSTATGRTRRQVLVALGGVGLAGVAGCSGDGRANSPSGTTAAGASTVADEPATSERGLADTMTIFHAGSLSPPFGAAEPDFEDEYDVAVNREAKGSVASTQKITEQGRPADVLGVSDFRLIRDRIVPEYGDWYTIFTTNAMSIQYREDSPGAEEITADNWWEILGRDEVTIGHSDPAVDPGGYRAVMMLKLGKTAFDGERLYGEDTYQKMRDNTIVPTGTETNLYGQLEAGGKLDYAIYYQSISSQNDLPWITLQPEVDLSMATTEYAEHYAKATVETASGDFTGAPIAYGMTVPTVAEAPERGAQWVEFFGSDAGRTLLENKGLQPVDPIVVPQDGADAVPDRVRAVAEPKQTLGPMNL